jgi:predicted RNA-binding Zn ribbon-like protein
VDFSDYTNWAVQMAADLVNELDVDAGVAGLERFIGTHEGIDPRRVVRRDAEEVAGLAGRLRRVFTASEPAVAARLLNRMISDAEVRPELTDHDGSWHLHYAPRRARLAQRMQATLAMALATVVGDQGFERLKVCDADHCDDVFVDLSRNHSRRYCSDRCANRENVAAFRARRRAASSGL